MLGIRRPDRKMYPAITQMRAQRPPKLLMCAFADQMLIKRSQPLGCCRVM